VIFAPHPDSQTTQTALLVQLKMVAYARERRRFFEKPVSPMLRG
jgi:hypothetical protein